MSGAPLARDEAIELLARRLLGKLEHLDPTGETWEALSDGDRDLWRSAVRDLFCAPKDWLDAAIS
jgi:hypothetical protein